MIINLRALKMAMRLEHSFVAFLLPLSIFLLFTTSSAQKDDIKTGGFLKTTYQREVKITNADKDKLVKELINIIIESYDEIPTHYKLPMDHFHEFVILNPSGLNATMSGNAQPVRGVRRNALLVNGRTGSAVIHRSSSQVAECFYDLSYCKDGYTIGFWANFPELPSKDYTYLSTGADEQDNHGIAMALSPRGEVTFTFKKKEGHEWVLTTTTSNLIAPNKWYHFLATWSESAGPTLYVDGKPTISRVTAQRSHPTSLKEPREFWFGRSVKQPYYPEEHQFIIDDVNFWMEYKQAKEVKELGPISIYHLPISTIHQMYSSSSVSSSNVHIGGKPEFAAGGKTQNALEFNGKNDYISEDISRYCFSNVSECFNGFLLATWLKFGPFQNLGHYITTGDYGLKLYYKDKMLIGEVQMGDKYWRVSWNRGVEGQWYFVELSMDPDEGLVLYIDQREISTARSLRNRAAPMDLASNEIQVGRTQQGVGHAAFTVDDFELWYGDRNMLEAIGYIVRGRPIRYHIPMDYMDGDRIPHQNLSIKTYNHPRLVTGKIKSAISLDGNSQYIYLSPQQYNQPPCFGNLNFCKFGATFSMWLKPGTLLNGMDFFHTGVYGFKMWQQDGLTRVSARTSDREWSLVTNQLVPDRWQFVELSFDPSSYEARLKLYIDGKLVGQSDVNGNPRPKEEERHFDGIYFGRGDGTRSPSKFGNFTIDEVEYWLANRDYLTKFNFIQRGQLSDHVHVAMDDVRNNKVVHSFMDVKVIGEPLLVAGKVRNALNFKGPRQYLDLGNHKDSCFGNLAMCQDGVTSSMWVNFNSFPENGYLFSNGGGIQAYTVGGKLFIIFETGGRKWEVSVPGLKAGKWYFIEYTWKPEAGLQLYINNRLVGQTSTHTFSSKGFFGKGGQVLIGAANPGEPGGDKVAQTADAIIDEFEFWFNDRDSLIASKSIIRDLINYILFSFETQRGNVVYHPDFIVNLHNGAHITSKGRVGNGLLLEGSGEYVSFGNQRSICMGNLNLCPQGLTISMLINPKDLPSKGHILSAAPYSIYTDGGRIHARFTNGTKTWLVSSDALKANVWQQLDLSWHPDKGLQLFIDDRLRDTDEAPVEETARQPPRDHTVYLGRPVDDIRSGRDSYSNAYIDELQFWYASRDFLDLDPVINRIILDMDVISGNRLVNPYQTIIVHGGATNVPAINATGVFLNGNRQYLESSGSQLVCFGNLENCQYGFTLRFKLKPNQILDNQYLVSSAPLDIYIQHKKLIAEMRTPNKMWRVSSRELSPETWYQIDLSWSPVDGAVLYINGEKVDSNEGQFNPGGLWAFNPSKNFYIGRANTNMNIEYHGNGIFDDFQLWEAKRDLLIRHNLIRNESITVTSKPGYNFTFPDIYPGGNRRIIFDGNKWYYYDINQFPPGYHVTNQIEKMGTKFITTHADGLIWFNGDASNNVHLVLKDGRLYFITVKDGVAQRYVIGQHQLNDNKWHDVLITRNGQDIDIELDGINHRQRIDYIFTLLRPNITYMGGSSNTGQTTKWFIDKNFDGKIREFWISGNNIPTDLDFKGMLYIVPHLNFVNGSWPVVDEYDDYIRLIRPRPVLINITSSNDTVRPIEDVPITFIDGTAVIFLPKWKPSTDGASSLELNYKTLSPHGILLFIQSEDQRAPGALIELYDGVPYLVADFGRGYQRLPFGNRPRQTNDNRRHYIKLLNTDSSLKLTLDDDTFTHHYVSGRNRSLDILSSAAGGLIHLGGIHPSAQLPWHSWNEKSRSFYRGCVWDVRINSGPRFDLAKILADQNTAAIQPHCLIRKEYCESLTCRNGGICKENTDRYFCDCSDTHYAGHNCQRQSKFVALGGSDRFEIIYNPTQITHTNDFSLRFKTPKDNAFLFSASNNQNEDTIKVTLDRGIGKVESRFGGASLPTYTSFECPQPLNDNMWHTVHVKRRANYLEAYIDECPKVTVDLPERNFKFHIDKILLGKDYDSSFVGHLQNLFIDGRDVFHSFDTGERDIIINTNVTITSTEKSLPFNPVTIRANTFAHLVVPSIQLLGDTKIQFMFKTKDPDVILLYNPGTAPDFFAVELAGGYLHVVADDGTGTQEITSSAGILSDGNWHLLSIEQKSNNEFEVIVDGRHKNTLSFPPSRHTLDLTERLYIGSVTQPMMSDLPKAIKSRKGFSGCLASLVINRIVYTLDSDRFTNPFITAGCSSIDATGYCIPGLCKNGGICRELFQGYRCDCNMTSFVGPKCNEESEGFIFSDKRDKGIVVLRLEPAQTTSMDTVALGFITYEANGTLVKIDGANQKDFINIQMVNGYVVARYRIGDEIKEIIANRRAFNDGKYHRLVFIRNGGNATLRIDDYPEFSSTSYIDVRGDSLFNDMSIIKVGGDLNARNEIIEHFDGIIAGVYINGLRVMDDKTLIVRGDAGVAYHPFYVIRHFPTAKPTPGPGGVATLPPDVKPPIDPYPTLHPPVDTGPDGGGIGWDEDGTVVVDGNGDPHHEAVVAGVPVPAIDTVGARAAGVAGAMLGALLLASSAMWAFYKFKPGLLGGGGKRPPLEVSSPLLGVASTGATDLSNHFPPISGAETNGSAPAGSDSVDFGTMHRAMQTDTGVVFTGGTGGTIQGYHISGGQQNQQTIRSTASEYRQDSSMQGFQQDQAPPLNQSVTYSYERSQVFTHGGVPIEPYSLPSSPTGGQFGTGQFSMRNVDLSYGGFNQQDVFTQQQHQRMLQQQQHLLGANSTLGYSTTGASARNFMAAEEIRVDCVQMTNNGRYVVTGSNCGPPQVWDLKTGELVKVMRGDELSSTDLHLANGDTLLVGQVAELEPVDMADSSRVHHRRLQVWDFETGKPIEMSRNELCTASCIMSDGERIVLGRTDKFGGGTTIVVWDILNNEPVRQIKCDASFGFADHISYLNVSKDNRYIIAGFQNSYDGTANYVTFDLASPDFGANGMRVAALDAGVEVTALLNEKEAVTGTRRGELVVWSMKTGKQLRHIGGLGGAVHHGEIKEVVVSRDGQLFVSASADGTLKLWDVESENLLHNLVGHKDEVWCATISPDNELVGSGSRDGTIRLWKVSDGASVAAIDAGMTIFKVLLSNNKKTVVALGDKGGARKLIMLRIVRSTATIDRRTGLVNA